MTIYKITTEVYLDPYNKSYYHIFTISPNINNDALNVFLKNTPYKKLSPFDYPSPHEDIHHCIQAFLNPKDKSKYLEIKHIDILFNILIDNGYKIEYDMTKLFKDCKNHSESNIICYVSK